MKRVYHLSVGAYIFYVFFATMILSGLTSIILTISIGEISDSSMMLVFVGIIITSMIYFYFYVIVIEDDKITFSQSFGLKRRTIYAKKFTKLMFRYYYPLMQRKKNTNRGQRGYKLNVSGPRDYIRILSNQYSCEAKIDLFDTIVSFNKEVYLNNLMKKEIEFINQKINSRNRYMVNEFDELISLGFEKEYFTRNGEEEIIFKKDDLVFEIFHFAGIKSIEIDVVITTRGRRFNFCEKMKGKREPFESVDETMNYIYEYMKRM